MGSIVVSPHIPSPAALARWGRPDPLGPMKTRKPSGGKVRIGSADFVGGPVSFRFAPVAPVFDPAADSMGPWSHDFAKAA